MSKRRTYEEKLLDDMLAMPANRWYKINDRPDYDKMVKAVKEFIDCYYDFEFNSDYSKLKRISEEREPLPAWHKMKPLPAGCTLKKMKEEYTENVRVGGVLKSVNKKIEFYHVYHNDKLIAIE